MKKSLTIPLLALSSLTISATPSYADTLLSAKEYFYSSPEIASIPESYSNNLLLTTSSTNKETQLSFTISNKHNSANSITFTPQVISQHDDDILFETIIENTKVQGSITQQSNTNNLLLFFYSPITSIEKNITILSNYILQPLQSLSSKNSEHSNWKIIAYGSTQVYNPQSSQTEELIFNYYFDDQETFQGILTIEAKNNNSIKTFTLFPEVGRQFLEAIYPTNFKNQGNLICTHWGQGASLSKITLYGINEKGQITEIIN